jgi:hypothetical protein
MNHNPNYGMILNDPQNTNTNENDLNNHNNDNDDYFEFSNIPQIKIIIIILFLSISLICLDIYSLYYSIEYLNFLFKFKNNDYFYQCTENQVLLEICFVIFATFIGISGLILSIGLLINNDYYLEKFFGSFIHYNYYLCGPFLLCSSIFGFINFHKIGYFCEFDQNYSSINYYILIGLIILLIIGSIITTGYSTVNVFEYFNDSIKFTSDANFFLGKAFWKFATSRNRNMSNYHERNE